MLRASAFRQVRAGASRRYIWPLIVAVVILAGTQIPALAHDGEGIDVGYGHVTAATGASGETQISLHLTDTGDCSRLQATEIIAERGEAVAYGDLEITGPCQFQGTVQLPETGRWLVTVWVAYNGNPADIQLPVGYSGEAATFERADWLHVEESISAGSDDPWYRPSGVLPYAVIGLLAGTALEVARRRWLAGGDDVADA